VPAVPFAGWMEGIKKRSVRRKYLDGRRESFGRENARKIVLNSHSPVRGEGTQKRWLRHLG